MAWAMIRKLEQRIRGMFPDPTKVSRTLIICNNILTETPPIPGDLSAEISDFIGKLLIKYPTERLGSGEEDAGELKRHPFFRDLSWEDLSLKKIPPPFVPKIENDVDVSNFSEEFTDMTPSDSPAAVPPNSEEFFKGYSYVAPTENDLLIQRSSSSSSSYSSSSDTSSTGSHSSLEGAQGPSSSRRQLVDRFGKKRKGHMKQRHGHRQRGCKRVRRIRTATPE
ncbi:hypothetical protein C0J52_25547 [Blattella germanica]|nr:hypothetical protein C0J52_25547 [Blattella germanica]